MKGLNLIAKQAGRIHRSYKCQVEFPDGASAKFTFNVTTNSSTVKGGRYVSVDELVITHPRERIYGVEPDGFGSKRHLYWAFYDALCYEAVGEHERYKRVLNNWIGAIEYRLWLIKNEYKGKQLAPIFFTIKKEVTEMLRSIGSKHILKIRKGRRF